MTSLTVAKVGLLDFGLDGSHGRVQSVLAASLRTAVLAEELGFDRYWFAEHHAASCAWANPIPVVTLTLASTSRIRVGTGGTLLSAYPAAAVANDFAFLSSLFPGRVDLGMARGVPVLSSLDGQPVPARIRTSPEAYAAMVHEVICRLSARAPAQAEMGTVPLSIPPAPRPAPDLWILGTSEASASLAASIGAPFAFSLFHKREPALAAIDHYRSAFVPGIGRQPRLAIAVAGTCGPTDHKVEYQVASRILKGSVWPTVVGSPRQCADALQTIHERYYPDLVIYLDVTSETRTRLRSVESLALSLS